MAQFPIRVMQFQILSGQSLSNQVYCGDADLVGIIMDSAWTAASITFQSGVPLPNANGDSQSAPTFNNLFNQAGSEVTITTPAASEQISIPADSINGSVWIKVRSGTSASPVTQGATRTMYAIARVRPTSVPR